MKAKDKGTRLETDVLRWFRDSGFPWAERLALSGSQDCGDISLLPGRAVIVECKNVSAAASGQPGAKLLHKWLMDTQLSPPFRDSDALRIIIKRLEKIEQLMRDHCYGREMEAEMNEAAEWLEWLQGQIAERKETL